MAKKVTEKSETKRLEEIFQVLPPNKYQVAKGLIVQAARHRVRLDYLWRDIQENGETEEFRQSPLRIRTTRKSWPSSWILCRRRWSEASCSSS